MIRQLPLIPTVLVLAAAGVMVWLGFWQLGRADEKAALIAEFEAQLDNQEILEVVVGDDGWIYRQVKLLCAGDEWQAVAGRNVNGQSGYAHRYKCASREGYGPDGGYLFSWTYADIGWSRSPQEPDFSGGEVTGTLVALGDDFKVVASEPLAGLQPLAKPDPNDLPNNHLAYAGQWFFFALTALVIYFFALRSRLAKRD